ncbi:uncharacterized protein LOC141857043 [Brevipalpus obovatus]|uniref:uncharacterized protein LOC141857043 n=1 Tax=Brevipalpus obovatus TaxID=246614 RepID=UPI003D9F38F0
MTMISEYCHHNPWDDELNFGKNSGQNRLLDDCDDSSNHHQSSSNSLQCDRNHFRSNLFMSPMSSSLCKTLYLIVLICFLSSLVTVSTGIVIVPSSDTSSYVGEAAFIVCTEDLRNMDGLQLRWKFQRQGSEQFEDIYNSDHYIVDNTTRKNEVTIIYNRKEDSGVYRCDLFRRDTGEILDSKNVKLWALHPIVFTSLPTQTIRDGSTGTIDCKFTKDVDMNVIVKWIRNNTFIQDSVKYRMEEATPISASEYVAKLMIKQVNKSDAGTYGCQVAYNDQRSTQTKRFQMRVEVLHPPRFPVNHSFTGWIDESRARMPNANVTLSCKVEATPVAKVTWVPEPTSDPNFEYLINNGENESNLTVILKNTRRRRNFQKYSCSASNNLGYVDGVHTIQIGKLPMRPTVINHTEEDNVLNITIEVQKVEPPIDKYHVEIAGHRIEFFAHEGASRTPQTYSVQIKNVPGGDHSFRVAAHNPVGWSEPLGAESMKLSISHAFSLISDLSLTMIMLILSSWTLFYQ